MTKTIQFFYNLFSTQEMVRYWKTSDSVAAKLTQDKDGRYVLQMKGEKYAFPGFPRGSLLYGSLSPLKHKIKNLIFNDSWKKLEEGVSRTETIQDIKKTLDTIVALSDKSRFDMVPYEKMCPAVQEIYRAWTVVEKTEKHRKLKECLCFILNEDDGYRFRVQWLTRYFWFWKFRNPIKLFETALSFLEHAEVVGDMKERQRLLKRILMLILEDESIKDLFIRFFKEV
ncbi:MAG: hypothetical protein NUV80_01275, partial [Candidatus Berkelbacteria bacterium]|nr:hypothetical protein [Candidatus Berkelbacteria bacterium]